MFEFLLGFVGALFAVMFFLTSWPAVLVLRVDSALVEYGITGKTIPLWDDTHSGFVIGCAVFMYGLLYLIYRLAIIEKE